MQFLALHVQLNLCKSSDVTMPKGRHLIARLGNPSTDGLDQLIYTEAVERVPRTSSTSTAEAYRPMGALICAPWQRSRAASSISRAIATPSERASSGEAARLMRSRIESGTDTRSSFFMNSALRTLTRGQIPATTGM